jgi:hypothetical protein
MLDNDSRARIQHWVDTGHHIFEGSKTSTAASASENYDTQLHMLPPVSDTSTSDSSSELFLNGEDNDPLIPSTDQINLTFLQSQSIWSAYLADAYKLQPGSIPSCCLDLHNMIQHVPPLPQDLSGRQNITGHAVWHIEAPELHEAEKDTKGWNPERVSDPRKQFNLSVAQLTKCNISPRSEICYWSDKAQGGETPSGIALLVMCWSYILSARLLEMQHKRIMYSAAMALVFSKSSEH